MFNGFRIGDRVRLRNDIGLLKAGSVGLVVEEYETLKPRIDNPEKIADGDYEIAVVWPALRFEHPPVDGPWIPKGLDGDNLHDGDIVPMSSRELDFVDNLLAVG